MADQLDFPMLEDQVIDHLGTVTGWPWASQIQPDSLAPAGGVHCADAPSGNDVDQYVDMELTVLAGTRTGAWQAARRVDRIMRGLDFLARSYIDELDVVFGWAVEDPTPTGLHSATATYRATVRRQPEPKIDAVA